MNQSSIRGKILNLLEDLVQNVLNVKQKKFWDRKENSIANSENFKSFSNSQEEDDQVYQKAKALALKVF